MAVCRAQSMNDAAPIKRTPGSVGPAPHPTHDSSPQPLSEPDISTLEKTGHFYLALTAKTTKTALRNNGLSKLPDGNKDILILQGKLRFAPAFIAWRLSLFDVFI